MLGTPENSDVDQSIQTLRILNLTLSSLVPKSSREKTNRFRTKGPSLKRTLDSPGW